MTTVQDWVLVSVLLQLSLEVSLSGGSFSVYAGSTSQSKQHEPKLLSMLTGEVGAGNYSYFTIGQNVPIKLVLTSEIGDADLYLSSEVTEPTYDFSSHGMSSVSCGVDSVLLDQYMERPVYIGVYGHPRHEVSVFKLEAFSAEEEYDPFFSGYSQDTGGGDYIRPDGDASSAANSNEGPRYTNNPYSDQRQDSFDEEDGLYESPILTLLSNIIYILAQILF